MSIHGRCSSDLRRASDIAAEATRRENEAFVRTLFLVRRPFRARDMLFAMAPNEAGYYVSGVYHGEAFDPAQYHIVEGGWDHEHCYLCAAKVLPGVEWWAAKPANFEDEIGLCLECHAKVIG